LYHWTAPVFFAGLPKEKPGLGPKNDLLLLRSILF